MSNLTSLLSELLKMKPAVHSRRALYLQSWKNVQRFMIGDPLHGVYFTLIHIIAVYPSQRKTKRKAAFRPIQHKLRRKPLLLKKQRP